MKKNISFHLLFLTLFVVSGCSFKSEVKEYLTTYENKETNTLAKANDDLAGVDDSCVAYYKFNEGSGSIINDETNKHDGVVVNCNQNSWVKGEYGNALNFKTSNNQYVYVDDSPDLTPTSITIEMIVKFDASSRYIAFQRLIFKDWAYNVFLENTGTPYLNFNLYTETNTAWETAKVRLNGEVFDGEFHHIAFTYNGITGLTRGYFDYWCEDNVYLSPGRITQMDKNYPLYIGAGYWADSIQQASTVCFDTLKISSKDLYATEFLDSYAETDNYLDEINKQESIGSKVYDIKFKQENDSNILDSISNTPIGEVSGPVSYSEDGLYLKQDESEATLNLDKEKFASHYLGVETIVKFDENYVPDPYSQLDGTVLYKENDFMICTYVYDAGNNTLGYIVTFRVNIADTGLISVENQMCVNYNIYDGKAHHLALNYNPITATMDGYIDYKKVVSKSFMDMAVSDVNFNMSDSPLLIGKSINNWQGNGWYNYLALYDGNMTNKDMYGYSENEYEDVIESGNKIADITFNEKVTSQYSIDYSGYENNVILSNNTSLYKDNEKGVLNIEKEDVNMAYINNSSSLCSSSLSLVINVKFDPYSSYGLHRLLFKDFQYDLCVDIKSNGASISTKMNTKKDGWLTRASGSANSLLDGNYHEIIMTYNSHSGVVSLYLDKVLIATETWGGEILSSSNNLYIGSGYWANALHQGCCCYIDSLSIYDYAITLEENV